MWIRCATLVALCSVAVWAQPAKTPAEQEINDLFAKSGQALANRDFETAIKTLQIALDKARKNPALKDKDLDALRGLGKAYVEAKRYDDAIASYRTLLDRVKGECVAGILGADRCADIRYDLGTAQMYKGDFAGATATLQSAVNLYSAVIKAPPGGDFRLAKENLRGNAQSMLAAAIFRSGKTAESVAAFQKAIDFYTALIDKPEAGEALKMMARKGRSDAQSSLNMIRADVAAQKK